MPVLTLTPSAITPVVDPVIALLPRADLRAQLQNAFAEESAAVATIEEFFALLPTSEWSRETLRTFVNSWKATHLKMLAIYGLSCRMQRSADASAEPQRSEYYVAAGRNAATSYEDLGLDFDGRTHAELYEDFADALIGDDSWTLKKYRLPEAHSFSKWVYRNMVVEDVPTGLLTNMMSEIYNHGEYSIALPSVTEYFRRYTSLDDAACEKAVTYIGAHVADDTEAEHFMVVVDSLERYFAASGNTFDPEQAGFVFRAYLRNLAPVMRSLTALLRRETESRETVASAHLEAVAAGA